MPDELDTIRAYGLESLALAVAPPHVYTDAQGRAMFRPEPTVAQKNIAAAFARPEGSQQPGR